MKVKSESEVAQSCPTLRDPWSAAYQAPPSMGFSRQEYWSGVPLPSPFLYTNNEKTEREIKETISFTITTKRIKYLGINLPKETKQQLELDMQQQTGSK